MREFIDSQKFIFFSFLKVFTCISGVHKNAFYTSNYYYSSLHVADFTQLIHLCFIYSFICFDCHTTKLISVCYHEVLPLQTLCDLL